MGFPLVFNVRDRAAITVWWLSRKELVKIALEEERTEKRTSPETPSKIVLLQLQSVCSCAQRFVDVGVELKKVFERRIPDLTLKYIDPSYIIRRFSISSSVVFVLTWGFASAPAEPHDEEFCVLLAQMAVHAAMAGKTCITIAHISGGFLLICGIRLILTVLCRVHTSSSFEASGTQACRHKRCLVPGHAEQCWTAGMHEVLEIKIQCLRDGRRSRVCSSRCCAKGH